MILSFAMMRRVAALQGAAQRSCDRSSLARSHINQRFFMVNNTIPEGFGSFYRISRIQKQEWYADLMESGADSSWIYADTLTYFDHITVDAVGEDNHFIYLRVVRSYAFHEDKTVTLENEIHCIESFVMLQKVRYEDQIELKIDIEERDFALCCPKFILQPVVENSIRHGMRPDGGILHIHLRAKRVGERILEVSVEDDGVGISDERLKELLMTFHNVSENADAGFGIGLYTVNQQLKIHYGDECTLRMWSELGRGTVVILPIRINDGD